MGEGGDEKKVVILGFALWSLPCSCYGSHAGGLLHFFFVLENVFFPHNAVINFLRMVSAGDYS